MHATEICIPQSRERVECEDWKSVEEKLLVPTSVRFGAGVNGSLIQCSYGAGQVGRFFSSRVMRGKCLFDIIGEIGMRETDRPPTGTNKIMEKLWCQRRRVVD